MSDHDTYRRLMRETEAQAPSGPVGRALTRGWYRLFPVRPPGMYSASENRRLFRDIREFADGDEAWLRRRQAEVEAEMVRTGEMPLAETMIPVRAGIERLQERLLKADARARRQQLLRLIRRGPHGGIETIRDKLRQMELLREEEREQRQRRINATIDGWIREGIDKDLPSPSERVRLYRDLRTFMEGAENDEWLLRREREAERERRRQLLRSWMRRDPRTGKQHPVFRRRFWR